jgi:Flp pilus assembly protein TadG
MAKAKKTISRKQGERGLQLVEMAVALPFMLVVMAGITEFGNYFYTYASLSKATRAAARHLSSHAYNDTEKAVATTLAICGRTDTCPAGSEILPGLTASHISIANTGTAFRPTTVTARIVNYQYTSVLNLAGLSNTTTWLNLTVSPGTTMRFMLEY